MATTLYSKKSTGIQSERGFTLAELLIVVAIIGVLTAIAVPVFASQLESSKQASDLASIRNAYAEAAGDALTQGGKDGEAETGLMKHTGVFNKLGEATIGNLDLTTNPDANPIVKDYSVIVTVSSEDGSVSLKPGNGGHVLGTTTTADEISWIEKENIYYTGRNDFSYEDKTANGNVLKLHRRNGVAHAGAAIYSNTVYKTAEYGVPMTCMVNDGSDRLYFIWDGACWYQSTGEGGTWTKVPESIE